MGFAVAGMICIGIGNSMNDWIACLVLWIGLSRHDYCNLYIYMILNLISAFKLVFDCCYAL